jgi:DDE domain
VWFRNTASLMRSPRSIATLDRQHFSLIEGVVVKDWSNPHPRVINTDKEAAYPPAIIQLKAEGALEENCGHRPVQYLNNVLEQDHRAIKRRVRASQHFRSFWGSLAHDRRSRSDSYDSQRPGVRECGGYQGRSTAPLHSRAVRGGRTELPIIYADFRLDYKLATLPGALCSSGLRVRCAGFKLLLRPAQSYNRILWMRR